MSHLSPSNDPESFLEICDTIQKLRCEMKRLGFMVGAYCTELTNYYKLVDASELLREIEADLLPPEAQ